MNDIKRLRTRFAPDIRFEVPAVPFRAKETTELERLKERLLLEVLRQTVDPELNTRLRRAANDAVALAWATDYPLLLFPNLFDEKAQAAQIQYRRQRQIRQRSQGLALATV